MPDFVRVSLGLGALCPTRRRHPQRFDAYAAILRNGRARARYGSEAAKESGLCFRRAAEGAAKCAAAHAGKRIDRRLGARKTDAARGVLSLRSGASGDRDAVDAGRRRRARGQSPASPDCALPRPGADMDARAEPGHGSLTRALPHKRAAKWRRGCTAECPLSGAKRTLTNRCPPISIYEYMA